MQSETRLERNIRRGKLKLTPKKENLAYNIRRGRLSAGQKRIIDAIKEWSNTRPEPAKTSEIARMANVCQTYVQFMLIPLELTGYITVLRDKDGRAYQTGCIFYDGI